ncbi:IS3 family transposase [Corynebacterium variabile]|uniref:IS3 family transposase n=1 Tax=Corynebacterium variabile TaxID=1727 RepID=UPI003FD12B50
MTDSPQIVQVSSGSQTSPNSLYKAELIHNQGPWTEPDKGESATMENIEWYNTRRVHDELSYRTPVAAEQNYYNHHTAATAT